MIKYIKCTLIPSLRMMYGWFEWRGLRASRQGWTPWTLQDRQGRESADASFDLLFFLEEGCDCSYHLQGRLVTGLEYHGDQVLITQFEVKAGQNLPASPDDPLYFRQHFFTFELTFIFILLLFRRWTTLQGKACTSVQYYSFHPHLTPFIVLMILEWSIRVT